MNLQKHTNSLPLTLVRKMNALSKSSRFIKRTLNSEELTALSHFLFVEKLESTWFDWGTRQVAIQVTEDERPCIFCL